MISLDVETKQRIRCSGSIPVFGVKSDKLD